MKGRYPLAWWKMRCYDCGGVGHRRRDHRKMKKIDREDKKGIAREEKKIGDKKEDKKMEEKKGERVQAQTPGKDKKKKKIKRRDIGVETEREIVE